MENLWTGAGYGTIVHKSEEEDMAINIDNFEKKEWKPVYCTLCEHWRYKSKAGRITSDRCYHPSIYARREWAKDNPVREGYYHEYVASGNCWSINANNDCELFKKVEFPDRIKKWGI